MRTHYMESASDVDPVTSAILQKLNGKYYCSFELVGED